VAKNFYYFLLPPTKAGQESGDFAASPTVRPFGLLKPTSPVGDSKLCPALSLLGPGKYFIVQSLSVWVCG
jgi:hypothetical protein